ncbi:tubulin glycylase 3A isoform X2 [Acyrthosiphon pisum]|uniref:Tubulin glycylase 3A-like n=1 Tax=Acyrthosiphon pisum TaxID=7029 RepID=A0A8R1W630_ACYPI|nr:tubulin glycylase 3A isoform X2 [Acyrthosiphon pisum]|eukprot:XP_003244151.1 PREDICTED: tubulin glycylase 3A-like isoform X2 [Acyrthosiphon pisum]
MNSNKNTIKRKTLTHRNDNKPLLNPKDKTKSYTLSTPNPIVTVEIPENTHNHISNTDLDNEVKEYSTTNNNITNDKQDSSNQILELKEESQNLELSSFNTRYQLNSRNYIQELHKALIKECNYNLLDYTSLNATLDFESLTTVTSRTLNAVKNGLAQCLESYKNAVTNLMFPRCHYIRSEADSDAFVEDYITTALISTLKIIVKAIENNKKIFTTNGNIPYTIIDFVKRCVSKFLNKQITGSTEIDMWMFNSQKEVWNEFMIHYTKLIIDNNAKFDHEYTYELELDVYAKCKYLLENVKNYCPQHYIDGITNTWIIKPSSNCSGHGIMLSRDLHTIKRKITESGVLRNNYILQKYIERPLLVYTCKIDLRQWFLVTNMSPVVVWMYKEGYVRFCANSFSMQNMHESIHLSNVRLQMKYRKIRNPQVPDECMWDYRELQDHLRKIGQEYVWDELIFPGMGESVYAVLKAATDTSYYREKSFQLFGADFLITENFIPYLIEINSIPGLNPSTSIIANLAPMLLSDIVKVTVDYEKNSNADTGLFMKVVPEKWKTPAAVRRLGSVTAAINSGNSYNSPAVTVDRGGNIFNSAVATAVQPAPFTAGYHNQWMDSVNKKLAALRLRINAQKTPDDRGFLCNKPHNT